MPPAFICCSSNTPRGMLSGHGACRRQFGLDEVMRMGSLWWSKWPYKKRPESLLFFSSPWEQTVSRQPCQPGGGLSPEPDHAGGLISDHPASKAVRKKCLSFKPAPLQYFAIALQAKTHVIYVFSFLVGVTLERTVTPAFAEQNPIAVLQTASVCVKLQALCIDIKK